MRAVFRVTVLLLLGCACAGPGRSYPCDPSLGSCGGVVLPDGGVTTEPFISDPFLVWHSGAQDSAADSTPFNGSIFAAFRHAGAWSGDAGGRIYVVRSQDRGRTWQKAAELLVPDLDPRQPRIFVFGGKLWIVATFWNTTDPTAHQTTVRIAGSADGYVWSPFALLPGTGGLAAWRPRLTGAQAMFSVWAADELFPVNQPTGFSMLSTSDCLAFAAAAAPPIGPGAREGDLLVRASGERWMAIPERSVGDSPDKLTFCHGASWKCWSIQGLAVESPALLEWNGILYLAGKRDTGGGEVRTSIWQVMDDLQDVSPVADVTAGFGATGGPSLSPLDDQRVLLVFHSTSRLDPAVAALPSEPTELQAEAKGYATDVLAVELNMPAAAAGR